MENEMAITPFEHDEFGQVRVVVIEEDPWFYAIDVAKALDYKDTDAAIRRHCEHAKSLMITTPTLSRGTPNGPNIIPRGDLYRLVVGSQKPNAKKFAAWVFDDVLPTLAKTGKYEIQTVYENPEWKPAPLGDNGDFFSNVLPVVEDALKVGKLLFDEDEVVHRSVAAVKKRYDLDLFEYYGGTEKKLLGPYDYPATIKGGKESSRMFTPTQLGVIGYFFQVFNTESTAEEVNDALKAAELQNKHFYKNSKGKETYEWVLLLPGEKYGKVFNLNRTHKDGRPITGIKWHLDVLEVIKDRL